MNELFLNIINMSILASWLILAVLLFRLILKKAPKWLNVLFWGMVTVRLICPLTIESPISMIPDSFANGEFVSAWMDEYLDDIDIHHPDSVYYDAAIGAGREPISDGEGGCYVVTKHEQLGEPATIENTVIPVLVIAWVAGMAILALYIVISYWRLHRKVDTAVLYKENIFQSENINSPFVLGIIKPRIYLPFKMDAQDLEHVIAHEQAHIRRKDHWWKPLGFLLLTIHWFNPLMWLAYVLLCRDIELACDEKVIKVLNNEQRADYTQALVACSVNRRMIAACPLAFGEISVKERVKSVMNYKKPDFGIVIMATIFCIIVAVCFLTNPTTIDDHFVITNSDSPANTNKLTQDIQLDTQRMNQSTVPYYFAHKALYEPTPIEQIEAKYANEEFVITKLHYENLDGEWVSEGYTYKYRLEITGRMNNAAKSTTYIVLSNTENITFDQTWKASGFSSNLADYFDPSVAIIVGNKIFS